MKNLNEQDKTTQEIIREVNKFNHSKECTGIQNMIKHKELLNELFRPVSICEQREKELLNEFFNDLSKLKEDTEINLRSEKTQNEIKEVIKPLLKQAVDEAIKQEREKVKEAIEELSEEQAVFNKYKLLKALNLEDK